MKVKIEADLALTEKRTLQEVAKAIQKPEVTELMEAFPSGEHFKMDSPAGTITITKL